MDDNVVLLKIIKIIAISICVIVILTIGSCQLSKYQMRKLIESGASPLDAVCALSIRMLSRCNEPRDRNS